MITLDENRLFSNKQTRIYIYRLTNDTGFAPCVDNGVFTLSCCKGGQIRKGKEINTGIRYWIGTGRDGVDVDNENVFLIGLFNGKMLFTARIDSVMEMIDYYSGKSKGRLDDIYTVQSDKKNLIWKGIKGIKPSQIHGDNQDQQKRDAAGQYVLFSTEYIYLGKKSDNMPDIPLLTKFAPKGHNTSQIIGTEAEKIVKECLAFKDEKDGIPHRPLRANGGCK